MTLDEFCSDHLNKTTQRFKTLIEKRYLLFFLITEDLKIHFACESLEDLLNLTYQDVKGKRVREVLGKENERTLDQVFTELTTNERDKHFLDEMRVISSSGESVYFDVEITSTVEEIAINGFAVFCHNITDTKRLEYQLTETNFELEQLVYAASHDLRAPLLSVEGLINVAEMEYPANALLYLSQIKKSVRRLDNFVTGLIYYAQNERIESLYEEVDIPGLVAQTVETWEDYDMNLPIRFSTDHRGETHLRTDRVRLDIILTCLISNAVRYADQHKQESRIDIRTLQTPEHLVLTVTDNGIGIREEVQPRVFDMFYKAGERSLGSGLGLYLVKKTVDRLKGKVALDSTYGTGTTVTATIPLEHNS